MGILYLAISDLEDSFCDKVIQIFTFVIFLINFRDFCFVGIGLISLHFCGFVVFCGCMGAGDIKGRYYVQNRGEREK